MTSKTRDKFARIYLGVPKQLRGHIPEIEERGSRMALCCSCGYRKPVGTWGNGAGWGYAVLAVKYAYEKHKDAIRSRFAAPKQAEKREG